MRPKVSSNSHNQEGARLLAQVLNRKQSRVKAVRGSFVVWRLEATHDQFKKKMQNASEMVDKMSKFSRRFISLNTLTQVVK